MKEEISRDLPPLHLQTVRWQADPRLCGEPRPTRIKNRMIFLLLLGSALAWTCSPVCFKQVWHGEGSEGRRQQAISSSSAVSRQPQASDCKFIITFEQAQAGAKVGGPAAGCVPVTRAHMAASHGESDEESSQAGSQPTASREMTGPFSARYVFWVLLAVGTKINC